MLSPMARAGVVPTGIDAEWGDAVISAGIYYTDRFAQGDPFSEHSS